MGNKPRSYWLEALSLPLFLLLWQLLAMWLQHRLVPTPVEVTGKIWSLTLNGWLLEDLGKTLYRAMIAFVVAMVAGTIIGSLLGYFRSADRLFGSWVVVGLNVPAIVVAIACYIWLGLTDFALVLAVVINKAPLVIVNMREGVRSLSRDLSELADAYRMSFVRRLRLVIVPQLMPFVLAAARTGLSLIWKIVLVFEVLGSDGGMGFRVGMFFNFFDVTGILAYSVSFICVVLAIEYGIMRPLEERILGWRPERT